MIEFKLNEKVYNMPTNWDEMTLSNYIELARLEENKSQYILGELYLLKLIEALCGVEDGELDDVTLDIVNNLALHVGFLQAEPEWQNTKHMHIDGVDYVFPNDLNRLTMGEYISMKTFQESTKSQADSLPYILAIILRPGKLVKDEETGKENWIQDKFTASNIEHRKNIFLSQPVSKLMGPVTFFLNGNELFMNTIKDSTEEV